MKKNILALCLLIVFIFSGCSLIVKKAPYSFRQSVDQIEAIEILKKIDVSGDTNLSVEIIKELDKEQHQGIVNDILSADGNYVAEGAGSGFGPYIIRITYKNGEIELIGEYNNGYAAPGGEINQGIYWFNKEHFYAIISQYVEVEGVPGVT